MKTYKFKNLSVELIDPVIEDIKASFTIGAKSVDVTATLNANGNKLFGVNLGQMPNKEAWGDEDVTAFATAQLEGFKIVQ